MTNSSNGQIAIDELGIPLSDATFIVVDLETTGGSPDDSEITEIGAVKVRGGQVIGEFQTLVNPGSEIPPFITVLTGITDAMVVEAPRIDEVLPAFFEFVGSEKEVFLVAHNAPFDISFLRAATLRSRRSWPKYRVLDTAKIARRVLTRDDVPNNKLSTLAPYFGAEITPNHRALDDAKATVDVLHGLIERLGTFGVSTIEDLIDFSQRLTPAQQAKRHLLQGLPRSPGIYIFRGPDDEALYIGVSKNIASRVRSYFSNSEARSRVLEMIAIAVRIEAIVTPTVTEAEIREIRMIQSLKPRYNRRSKFPEKKVWLKLSSEGFPRLVTTRNHQSLIDDAGWAGPFSGVDEAEFAKEAIYEVTKLRQCTITITPKSMKLASPCALFEMHRCDAPCVGAQSTDSYASVATEVREFLHGDASRVESELRKKMSDLALDERFEDALLIRHRLSAFARGVGRGQEIRSLSRIPEMVIRKGSDLLLIRFGKLAASMVMPDVEQQTFDDVIHRIRSMGEHVVDDGSVIPSGNYEESEKLSRLVEGDVELIWIDDAVAWSMPRASAASMRFRLAEDLSDALSKSEGIDRMGKDSIRARPSR
ncbi:MAG: DEDD exonuclease domain-containing protein [Candidatus Nanopelagicaceae bacterium]|jgi:DNA polymerase-3 subunit epsilon